MESLDIFREVSTNSASCFRRVEDILADCHMPPRLTMRHTRTMFWNNVAVLPVTMGHLFHVLNDHLVGLRRYGWMRLLFSSLVSVRQLTHWARSDGLRATRPLTLVIVTRLLVASAWRVSSMPSCRLRVAYMVGSQVSFLALVTGRSWVFAPGIRHPVTCRLTL
jgi:hypothetical protein